jgi:hypothetical protein
MIRFIALKCGSFVPLVQLVVIVQIVRNTCNTIIAMIIQVGVDAIAGLVVVDDVCDFVVIHRKCIYAVDVFGIVGDYI